MKTFYEKNKIRLKFLQGVNYKFKSKYLNKPYFTSGNAVET